MITGIYYEKTFAISIMALLCVFYSYSISSFREFFVFSLLTLFE